MVVNNLRLQITVIIWKDSTPYTILLDIWNDVKGKYKRVGIYIYHTWQFIMYFKVPIFQETDNVWYLYQPSQKWNLLYILRAI